MLTDVKKHSLSLLALVILALLAVGSMDSEEDTKITQSKTVSFRVTSNGLSREYEANEVVADNKYKGKVIIVSGIVRSIGKDIMDQAYVVLESDVHCSFTVEQQSSFDRIAKGKTVSIKGEVSGLTIGSVMLMKCSIQ